MPVVADAAAFMPQDAAQLLSELDAKFTVGKEKLKEIAHQLKADMKDGLQADGKTIPMIPSYVTRLPTGDEKGTYLALDLGGTNLRVCEVQLKGEGKVDIHAKKYVVDDKYKKGKVDDLFDHIAEFVGDFVKERGHKERLSLGFTFSFAIQQTAIDRGTSLAWSKGFHFPDSIGKDIVELLESALKRKSVNVHVTALLNDTVGAVLASAYVHHNSTVLGFIFGTGTNAAYAEKQKNIPKWKGKREEDGMVLINTEWGAFDKERRVLPYTQYDEAMDAESRNPGEQRFEKLISGMYLGEIVRRVMVDLAARKLFANGRLSPGLQKMGGFDSKWMASIEKDTSAELTATKKIFDEEFHTETNLTDRQVVHRLCQLISTRSARISGAAVAAVLIGEGEARYATPPGTLAGDGSVFNLYPGFQDRMKSALVELMGSDCLQRYTVQGVKDGSAIGAAALAAVADQISS